MAIETIKNATKIKLYCHAFGYVNSNLEPIPIIKDITPLDSNIYTDLKISDFLEYNKITLEDKDQNFSIENSILAYKTPEYFIHDVSFAFKAFLPPQLEKVEFLNNENIVLYTKQFSTYDQNNNLIEADNTFSKWFIYSISQKVLMDGEIEPQEAYCFEYSLHQIDTNAHSKDIKQLPMQLEDRTLAGKSIYYALYTNETIDDDIQAKAQVINGNLITNDYRLFYLGNNIYDNTDEVNSVVDWANNKRNIDTPTLNFSGNMVTASAYIMCPEFVFHGTLSEERDIKGSINVLSGLQNNDFITFHGIISSVTGLDRGTIKPSVPNFGTLTQYVVSTGSLDTTTNAPLPNYALTGIMGSREAINDTTILGNVMMSDSETMAGTMQEESSTEFILPHGTME